MLEEGRCEAGNKKDKDFMHAEPFSVAVFCLVFAMQF
jgi:hypothetical protein